MERERRRYFRQAVTMPVNVVLGEKELKATSTNISEGGIAIKLHQALPKNAKPRLQFALPESKLDMDVESELAWADLKGHAGLRFLKVPPSSQELLEKWLDEQVGKELPGSTQKPPGSSSGSEQ
jgi:c-di-GMP-binding flagellar brake protein YcgR